MPFPDIEFTRNETGEAVYTKLASSGFHFVEDVFSSPPQTPPPRNRMPEDEIPF